SDFENMFVHKLDEMGAFVWVRQNEGLCTGESIAVGNNGEVYSTGYFRGPVDFDPGTDELELQSTFAFEDAFIQRLDGDGNLVWVKQIGGVDTEGKGVAADASGNVYVTGFFSGMVDFDPGSGTTNIGSVAASVDVFSVKLQSCSSSSASLMVDACGTYTSPTGQIITQSGTYTETISNAMGCDSVITINLTVTNLTANVSVSGSTLTANLDGASYQWIDCNNDDQPIDGATDQSYTPSASGDYAVIVSQNACVDTSVCFSVVVTNVADAPRAKAPLVFPNPSRGQVTIALGSLTEASVEVFNVHGQLIFRNEAVRDELYPFELEASPGMYLIRVRTKEQQWNYKLLRQ
ncbi:MAG: T9SS type A sorting domain-containing protein, partial [Bacteroidota bacterium]